MLREAEELFVQMDWLLNSLLKLSRLDAGIVVFQSEQIRVNNLIRAALRPLLIPMELHNITLESDVPEGMTIQGDFSWLSEAIQNILKNCMQSTGDNGTIRIVCEDTLLFGTITIHDSGTGFQKEDLPHLFERFYRGKNEDASGYGIGLSLCKMIITRHGEPSPQRITKRRGCFLPSFSKVTDLSSKSDGSLTKKSQRCKLKVLLYG